MKSLRELFFRHVCQTSSSPLGIEVARAEGSWIWDVNGRAYLDLLAGMGVANLGHGHPAVLAAIEAQLRKYLHVAVYGEMILEPQVRLAEALAQLSPGELSVVYFANSGAEAIEGALKAARKFTERPRFVAFDGAFHGDTLGALSLNGNPLYREPFEPLLPVVDFLPFGEAQTLERISHDVAAVVVEPVQSEGGVRIPPDEFLPLLRERCREVGAVLIFDEVLTGFGRTGKLFAANHWEVAPDILVLAKALGGGLPLGAFIGPPEIMHTLGDNPPLAHVTTFGGHPLSCAAGLAALRALLDGQWIARAERVGRAWLSALEQALSGYVQGVRGRGLLIGIEFENPEHTRSFVEACRERGVIANWTLHCDTVVRLLPPLTISEADLDYATRVMAEAVRQAR